MENRSLISIIVPVYKVEDYLHECVDSILAQTYTNLEIILVDDGSPDACGTICDEYAKKDARVRVIHKENGGLSDARNAGLDICTGAYISFIDSDDVVHIDFIKVHYNNIIAFEADISMCCSVRSIDRLYPDIFLDDRTTFYTSYIEFLLDESILESKTEVWKKMYKTEVWNRLRFPVGKKAEDTFVFPHVVFNRKIVFTDKALYFYRFNDASIMGSFNDELAVDANEALETNVLFFSSINSPYVKRAIYRWIDFNYAFYLRNKVYNKVCRSFLLSHFKDVFSTYPLKTSARLYFIIAVRFVLGKDNKS